MKNIEIQPEKQLVKSKTHGWINCFQFVVLMSTKQGANAQKNSVKNKNYQNCTPLALAEYKACRGKWLGDHQYNTKL